LNTLQKPQGKHQTSSKAAQKAAHFNPGAPSNDPDLASIVKVWPTLPEAIRAGIIALARAAGG